jgi:hypothetical protein
VRGWQLGIPSPRWIEEKVGEFFAEHLLNNRLQMRVCRCNWEACNANKTNENRSVRTGQGELANRRFKDPIVSLEVWTEHSVVSRKVGCHATVTVVVEKRWKTGNKK